jgi:hypothetical protein
MQVIYGQRDVDTVVRCWRADSDRVQVGGLVAIVNFEVLAAFVWPAKYQTIDIRAFQRAISVFYGIYKFTAATEAEQRDHFNRIDIAAKEKKCEQKVSFKYFHVSAR